MSKNYHNKLNDSLVTLWVLEPAFTFAGYRESSDREYYKTDADPAIFQGYMLFKYCKI